MTFEEWWTEKAELSFSSASALSDAYEAAEQAWNAGFEEGYSDGYKDGLDSYEPVV